MNKTLLLILCDFLLLNLLALTRWEKAEPARAKQPPVPEMSANAVTKDRDLAETMKLSLEDERAAREQLAQKLATTESSLTAREQNLAKLEADRSKLSASLTETQRTAAELNAKVAAATQDASITREELARGLELRLAGANDDKTYRVHNKLGTPCERDGTSIARIDFEEHTIYYCPTCQTAGHTLKDRRLSRLLK